MSTRSRHRPLSPEEKELLQQIKAQRLPPDLRRRFRELIRKRQDETLTSREHRELVCLTDQVEQMNVVRLECLRELARLRNTTLKALMDELALKAPRPVETAPECAAQEVGRKSRGRLLRILPAQAADQCRTAPAAGPRGLILAAPSFPESSK